MTFITTLWHLQTLDQEIDDKTKHARQVDEALANDPIVATARAELDIEQKKLRELQIVMRDRELEAKGLDAKIKELNDRLYSGRVTNPKELDGYSKDLEMYKRNRSAMDDKLLELMELVDQGHKRIDEKSGAVQTIESKRAGDLEHLTRERETLTARLAQAATERDKTRAALTADTLKTYDRLRQTKAGRAVVQLKRDSCGTCGMTVPTGLINRVRTGDEIVFCPGCSRILVP